MLLLCALACYFVFPDYLDLLSHVLILAIFVLSYDLLQGHAGIVSLGHAAFFGLGAYTAALLAGTGYNEPLVGLAAAAVVSGVVALLLTPNPPGRDGL